jgi:hypothetical protein
VYCCLETNATRRPVWLLDTFAIISGRLAELITTHVGNGRLLVLTPRTRTTPVARDEAHDKPGDPIAMIDHDDTAEAYIITSGSGILTTGGTIVNKKASAVFCQPVTSTRCC